MYLQSFLPSLILPELAATFQEKEESITVSNWARFPLSERQVYYAAQDAYASVWIMMSLFHRCVRIPLSPVSFAIPKHPSKARECLDRRKRFRILGQGQVDGVAWLIVSGSIFS